MKTGPAMMVGGAGASLVGGGLLWHGGRSRIALSGTGRAGALILPLGLTSFVVGLALTLIQTKGR